MFRNENGRSENGQIFTEPKALLAVRVNSLAYTLEQFSDSESPFAGK